MKTYRPFPRPPSKTTLAKIEGGKKVRKCMSEVVFVLRKVIDLMLEYQKAKGVVEQCMTNTQYLYDCIKQNLPSEAHKFRAEPCIVVAKTEDEHTILHINHFVIRFEGHIIDASYEVYSQKEKKYCFTIAEFMKTIEGLEMPQEQMKEVVSHHITFLRLAKRMNDGELLVCDKEFYNAQADYIEETLSRGGGLKEGDSDGSSNPNDSSNFRSALGLSAL